MTDRNAPRRMRSTVDQLRDGDGDEQARRLELALELGQVSAAVTDREGRLRWLANPPMPTESWYGKTTSEIIGAERAAPFEAIRLEALERDERVRRMVSYEIDDDVRCFDFVAEPIRDADGRLLGCRTAGRDVTELMGAQRDVELAKERAELANRTKDRFVALLSHELRTPLTPVLAISSEMAHREDLSAEVRETFAMITRNIERQARLVDDLLDLSRLSLERLRVDHRPVDLARAIEDAIEVEVPPLTRVTIETELAGDLWILGDRTRLAQAVGHLLRNAIAHAGERGTVSIRGWAADAFVVIEISDAGTGIAPERLHEIFQPFQLGFDGGGALGIGLSLARELVERHGGHIEAHSDGIGHGATFRLIFGATEQRPSQPLERHATSGVTLRRMLYVEDDPDTRATFALILKRYGYHLEVCDSVAAAAKAVEREKDFDVVLCDVGLPDGEGYDVMALLREHHIRVPAIALTGYGTPEDVMAARAAGFDAHLTKPVALETLLTTLESLINGNASDRRSDAG